MVIRKIRFEFNAIVFNSASKSHNKSNLFQYIWNGVYIGWGEEGGGGTYGTWYIYIRHSYHMIIYTSFYFYHLTFPCFILLSSLG